ncbi:hypothetical protein [Geomonas subterranea]|uniref:hypothetical protein n=1 Tax=Geomonas subterranea TaxID=2847989 RepID=UPI001CD44575|nr:hypothetical protein [Geomonas fuzhouensis]
MAEIFFIASDERALDLIESLRIQSPKSLTFETDLPSAMRRLPKEHPHYVFIQSSLDGVPGEEIAAQTRALVADPSVQLVLLADGEPPGSPPTGFDRAFNLALPTSRLSEDVMQLLTAEAVFGVQPRTSTDFSDLSDLADLPDLFVIDEKAEFEIPDFDDAAFEPHLAPLWPDQPVRGPVIEATAPPPPVFEATAPADEIVFLASAPEPSPVPPPPLPPLETVQAAPTPPAPPAPEPQSETAVPRAAKPSSPRKSLYPTPDQIYRKPPELCGEALEEEDETPFPSDTEISRNPRRLTTALVGLGILVLAMGVVVWLRSKPEPAPPAPRSALPPVAVAPAPPAAHPAPAAVPPAPPAAQPAPAARKAKAELPGFVPKVPADAAYAAAHPGWELYRGGGKQFRIYREQGTVRAIQVLADGEGSLDETLLKSYFKEATGADLPGKGETREERGLTVETRKAGNGAEIAIYRDAADRLVRGVVLQLPGTGR